MTDITMGTAIRRPTTRPALALKLSALWHGFQQLRAAAASRKVLAELDDRQLQDLGLSRTEALQEANRAPWDLAPLR